MYDLPVVALILLNALLLAWSVLRQYRTGQTAEILGSYQHYTTVMAIVVVGIFIFWMVAIGNIFGIVYLLAIMAVIVYFWRKLPGNSSKLSFFLFLLLIGQQLWFSYHADAHSLVLLLLLNIWIIVISKIACQLLGRRLARMFPAEEARHVKWLKAHPQYAENMPSEATHTSGGAYAHELTPAEVTVCLLFIAFSNAVYPFVADFILG